MPGPLQDLFLGDALATALFHVKGESANVPYLWDSANMRYVNTITNEPVDPLDVRAAVEAVQTGVSRELDRLAQQASTGDLEPLAWRTAMEGQLMVLHQAAALAATGGVQAQDIRSLNVVTERVQGELAFLDAFAADLVRPLQYGEHEYSPAELSARARQYATAALPTYENSRHALVMENEDEQYDVGRRVLMPEADHCEPCVALGVDASDEGGYIPVRNIVPIGATPCRSNCECTIQYARSDSLHPEQYTK